MSSGGKREGAGRKPRTGAATTTVAFRVSQETKTKMDWLKGRGVDIRAKFEDLVRSL